VTTKKGRQKIEEKFLPFGGGMWLTTVIYQLLSGT